MKNDKLEEEIKKELDKFEKEYAILRKIIRSKRDYQPFFNNLQKAAGKKIIDKYSIKTHNRKSIFIPSKTVFKYLIPSKRREEVIGDLIQTKIEMIEDGLPMWKVKGVLYFHMLVIILSMLRIRISDYGRSKKESA